MKKNLILVAAAALLVGCSGGDAETTTTAPSSPGVKGTPGPAKPTNSVDAPKMATIPPPPGGR